MMYSSHLGRINLQCIALLLCYFIGITNIHAQQPVNYIAFEANGITGGEIKIIPQGKSIQVLTNGGYIKAYLTDAFKKTKGLQIRAFSQEGKASELLKDSFKNVFYLYPGNSYFIEVVEIATNKTVVKYSIERPKLLPKIEFHHGNHHHFYSAKADGSDDELSLSLKEENELKIVQRNDFKNMEVDYSLRNLRTKQMQYGSSKSVFKDLIFEANTTYELRFNYAVQKENIGIIYIHVKPYWYQANLTYIILTILLIAIGVLILTLTLKKKINASKKENLKLEQAAIRLQSLLNPHFTFNALNAIQGLMNTNRIDEANQYLQEFSALLRQTLAKSQQVYTTIDQELEMMRLYIKLEAFRFNFSWEIEVARELNPSIIEIPTLLLQPLIENAIKHGLSKLGDQGKLQISCTNGQKKEDFVIMVKDNGNWVNKTAAGYGLSLTTERIAAINKMKKGQQIVLSFEKEIGTTAILTFHNWIEN